MKRTVFLLLALIGWFALPLHAAAPSQPPTLHSLDGHLLAERVSPTVERVWFPTGFYGGALNMSTADFLDQGDFKAPEVAFRAFIDKLAAANLNFARFWINYGVIPSSFGLRTVRKS